MMYYAIDKETNKIKITADSMLLLKNEIKNLGKSEEDYLILEDVSIKSSGVKMSKTTKHIIPSSILKPARKLLI